ncbi:dual specificity protein phosphatase family protein [Leptolyngbya sp. FACHB-711]|uniref:phosphatase domain-containing putative toxin n=1 Tax=unclassified Leptolyngbya TaxID=2650499 RepID=UPI001685BB1A|nr:dual specificity protein phosphatase family protein [Cyanobacteria bacterium FACHB-502]MBD2023748.1 dual specificity protein phosphatase family protein [Leptolyngbya sp. FACHB-711]
MYKFAAACSTESIVFGASRPGYTDVQIQSWISFMKGKGIQRVCCLLDKDQLVRYPDLLGYYKQAFGIKNVCWAAIADFEICDRTTLQHTILPFLLASDQCQRKTVVHCSGGIGRTGQILTAWLVVGRGLSQQAAVQAVRQMGRNPYEAVIAAPLRGKNPLRVLTELNNLLDACQQDE